MNILIFNPLGIGDVLFSTPALKALKRRYPDASISYICNKRTYEIVRMNPFLSKVYIFEKDDFRNEWRSSKIRCIGKILSLCRELRRERFSAVLDLSLGWYYHLIFFLLGIRERVGFDFRDRGKFLTKKLTIDGFNDKHAVEYYLDLVRLLGVNIEDRTLDLYLSNDDRSWAERFLADNHILQGDIIVGVIPGCGASWGKDADFRRWNRKNFAEVCNRLVDAYHVKVLIFGDESEVPICQEIAGIMKHKPMLVCGKTTLCQFLALVSKCSLVITNDGGPLHIAVSLKVKTVSIFGPVDEYVYGPYPPSADHRVVSRKGLACRPCYKKFRYALCGTKQCLESISVDEVWEVAKGLLDTVVIHHA